MVNFPVSGLGSFNFFNNDIRFKACIVVCAQMLSRNREKCSVLCALVTFVNVFLDQWLLVYSVGKIHGLIVFVHFFFSFPFYTAFFFFFFKNKLRS